jgi:hypothetical protein
MAGFDPPTVRVPAGRPFTLRLVKTAFYENPARYAGHETRGGRH